MQVRCAKTAGPYHLGDRSWRELAVHRSWIWLSESSWIVIGWFSESFRPTCGMFAIVPQAVQNRPEIGLRTSQRIPKPILCGS